MSKILPTTFIQHDNPKVVALMARHFYKSTRLVQRHSVRDIAKFHLLHELGRGITEEVLLNTDAHSGHYHYTISYGPYCGPTPYGKMRVHVRGKKEEYFSMRELLAEIHNEKRQPALL